MPNVRELHPDLAKLAQIECNEPSSPELINQDLKAIRDWLVTNPHIKAKTDDQFLIAFLRGCKYSLERVKVKLDTYYTVRTAIPELMEYRDPLHPKIKELFKKGVLLPLFNYEKSAYPFVTLIRTGRYSADEVSLNHLIAYSLLCSDYCFLHYDPHCIAGEIVVFDLENLTMQHIVEFTPMALKRLLIIFQESLPVRTKAIHYINVPSSMATVLNVLKSLMSEKLKQRLFVHKSIDELYQHLPKEIFPHEYGGSGGDESDLMAAFEQLVLAKRNDLLLDTNYGVDEGKRQCKSKVLESMNGMDGSFRKLVVD